MRQNRCFGAFIFKEAFMDTVKFNKKSVKMVAHRGVSGLERENTNAAFVAAGNRSYFGIETDVHVTKDEKFIIHHDDTVFRLTGVSDVYIEQTNYEDLKKLYLTEGLDVKRRDMIMPDLEDYISICKKYEKIAVLEIKNRMETKHLKKITEIIDSMEYLDGTIFISFSWENCTDLRKLLPNAKIQFLCSKWDDELLLNLKNNNLDLDIHFRALTAEIVQKLHENEIEVNCWTVDSPEDAERLASFGVDYITSNILE